MECGFGVILLLWCVWNTMTAHQQPMRVDRIRCAGNERDQILAGLNRQLFGISRRGDIAYRRDDGILVLPIATLGA